MKPEREAHLVQNADAILTFNVRGPLTDGELREVVFDWFDGDTYDPVSDDELEFVYEWLRPRVKQKEE